MLPTVVIHNLVSVDGRIDFWEGDIGLYYQLAAAFDANAILSGSETILKALAIFGPQAHVEETAQSESGATAIPQQHMVVVDSRGRVDQVHLIKKTPFWSDLIVLCAAATPERHLDSLQEQGINFIKTGEDHVDLRQALSVLAGDYGVRTIRVDSGGVLNGVLLRAGLVNEFSLLVAPLIIGSVSATSLIVGAEQNVDVVPVRLGLKHVESFPGDHVWLRYEVIK